MATAIAVRRWLARWSGCDIQAAKIVILQSMIEDQSQRIHNLEGELSEFKQALKSRAAKDSPFEQRDKIQPLPSGRYVPLARRRAQAERESLGPQTHTDKVRENNAKAIAAAG